ncbi:MAG: hypothetical protein QOG89_274 [Thermomicrobiales bacterium]|nr:hypothetical protein [Thermomicrobiales bacterium]MEA2528630.1 hypothetical protein [Thermomicrobiales bacterium]
MDEQPQDFALAGGQTEGRGGRVRGPEGAGGTGSDVNARASAIAASSGSARPASQAAANAGASICSRAAAILSARHSAAIKRSG